MLIHPWDAGGSDEEWVDFVRGTGGTPANGGVVGGGVAGGGIAAGGGFGHLVASGRDRDVPVVVPTQFALVSADLVLLHLARPNPIWSALAENPSVLLSIAGDWAYIPAAWKAIGDEDPRMGVPTTYYAAVQLIATAQVVDDEAGKAEILRVQLGVTEPGSGAADPAEHGRRLAGIRGLRLTIREVRAKFKYGGNVDDAHRAEVAERLRERGGPGDAAALAHLRRRDLEAQLE
ncbi:MAG: transcriptional regulator [Pseudonocardiales bacterium]|nr:transcriptional regulator [Pseudonocardiales bacterium]